MQDSFGTLLKLLLPVSFFIKYTDLAMFNSIRKAITTKRSLS
jgi:hypothetical protein